MVLWKEYCYRQGHFLAVNRILFVSAKRAEVVSAIKGYSLALDCVFILFGIDIALNRLSVDC